MYDLDSKRIVDFMVKAWGEPFILMRAVLYEDAMGAEMKNRFNSGVSSGVSFVEPPNTQSEPLAPRNNIQNFAHYVELTAYPQRSALEPLLTERLV